MDKQKPFFSGYFASGSGNSTNPSRGTRTRYVTYTTDIPPGFDAMSGVSEGSSSGEGESALWKGGFRWRRAVGAVKSNAGVRGQCDGVMVKNDLQKVEGKGLVLNDELVNENDEGERHKALELLALFRKRCKKLFKSGEGGSKYITKAYSELVSEGQICKEMPSLFGPVPGIEVGDKFKCRAELCIVGLHKHWVNGIDYVKDIEGEPLATCVVTTESSSDKMTDPDTIRYIGEGGNVHSKERLKVDQKLTNGNLALWHCKKMNSPVRVVRGYNYKIYDDNRGNWVHRREYVYDGLFDVSDCVEKTGESQKLFYEFTLRRCPGQPGAGRRGSQN